MQQVKEKIFHQDLQGILELANIGTGILEIDYIGGIMRVAASQAVDIDAVIANAATNQKKGIHAIVGKTIKATNILNNKRGRGQPEKYTKLIGDSLCKRISQGETITAICKDMGFHVESVYRWIDKYPEFRERYSQARKDQATSLISQLVDEFQTNLTNDNALAARTKSDLYKWIAARQAPAEFGEVKRVELKGEVTHTHIHNLADHQKRRIAEAWLLSQAQDTPGIVAETTGPALPALECAGVREIQDDEQGIIPKRKRSPASPGRKGKAKGKGKVKADLESD